MKLGGANIGVRFEGAVRARAALDAGARVRGRWAMECYGPDGVLKWREDFDNIVVNEGLDELLTMALATGSPEAAWYVGLKDTGTPAAADTMASHASWATITPYSDATDPLWVDAGVSGQSIDNSASKASFAINATEEVFGAFLKSNNTKGGSTGKLYAVGDFGTSRNVQSGDTLEVTATFTTADDGV